MPDRRHKDLETLLPRLYGYAVNLCRSPDEAKDLVQDCAVKALAARAVPEDASAYRSWLFKILKNAFIDRIRRRQQRDKHQSQTAGEADPGEYWAVDERLINVITVKMELSRLPQDHREIIALIDIAGLSYAEAAGALEIPVGTVMSRISRARAALIAAVGGGNLHVLQVGRGR